MTANPAPAEAAGRAAAAGDAQAAPALSVRNLTVDYRRHGPGAGTLRAVDDLSFDLVPGKVLALVGESGSGKSTVIRALSGFVAPTAGEIVLDGIAELRGRGARRAAYRRALQLVFQDPFASLNPMHTVARHLARPIARYRDARGRAGVRRAVHELLTLVNLGPAADFAAKYPHELSGGQRQRVAIARALATRPRVLLADEPVSMLDVSIRLEILNLLEELTRTQNLAMLYVTHDLATARHFSQNIMVMYRGTVVEQGPSDQVILNPAHPYTQMLATAAPDPSADRAQLAEARRARLEARGARAAAAERRVPQATAGACVFIGRCPYAREICADAPPPLPVREMAADGPEAARTAAADGHNARCWKLTDFQAVPDVTPKAATESVPDAAPESAPELTRPERA
ncbi:MAG TPA: oligopeptide/dipeptide ABC transporter ATP-binding protein [Actinospica sp.]|nr:oligopeptide/dipeptide ABC transporter ATP-binding protein [Actinospica sp.]